jgi:hypothetical protein
MGCIPGIHKFRLFVIKNIKHLQKAFHNFRDSCGHLVTITLEIVPFHTYAPFPVLLPFFKCILEVMFVMVLPPVILPQSPKVCQNGGLSVLSSVGQIEKSTVGGGDSHVVFC